MKALRKLGVYLDRFYQVPKNLHLIKMQPRKADYLQFDVTYQGVLRFDYSRVPIYPAEATALPLRKSTPRSAVY